MIRRFLISVLMGASLLSPSFVFAQDSFFDVFTELSPVETPMPSIDSFFDIFTELEMPDAKCDKCKAIEEEIALVEQEMLDVESELMLYDVWISLADGAIADTEANIKKLQAQLEEMRNPKSYVESEGRRYDSSDHAAMQRRNANLWKSYKGGRLTAQEYSDEIGKPFDDPQVQEDLELLKEIIEDELQDQIDEQEDLLQKVKDARDEMNEAGAELMAELEMLEEELITLREQLEDCNDRCTEEDLNIPEEYNIMPDDSSWWDWLKDIFNGPDEEESPFAGLDEILDELNKDMAGGGGNQPPEIDDAGLGGEPFTIPDDLFDFLDGLELPPVTCHLCDPIRAEIELLQNSINEMTQRQAQLDAQVDAAYRDLDTARSAKTAAERALDELNNPRSSAESEGRRIDSNDQAAMRVRNQRLWGAYKSGDLSAQELSDEWGKPFDDPAVKAELDAIKDQMRADLTQAIADAQAAIDKINADITAFNEELIDLAGKIAGHQVLLDFQLRQLEECEKRCREVQDDPIKDVIPDFEDFIFPGDDYDDEDTTVTPENMEVTVGWFDGLLDWIAELFPDGDEVGEPEEKTPEEAVEENIKVPQECVSPAVPMSQCAQTCTQECTKSGVRAWQEGNTVYIEDCGICPPLEIDICPTGTFFEKSQCERDNNCTCVETAKSTKGESCYACRPSTGTETSSVSSRSSAATDVGSSSSSSKATGGTSSVSSRTTTGGQSTVSSKSSSAQSSSAATPSCPNGTTSNRDTCESQCESQGGSCVGEDGCYSCVVTNCPAGTYKNECPTSCSGGCDVAGQESGTTCYQCKQSCEDVCAQNGYGGPNTDHSNAILSELNGYSCVSGASISIQTATIGSCQCIGEFSLSVNQTPPVCQGTPCGDVVCGGSASCPGGPNETITVNCNWGGWEKIQKHQFRPVVGD